MFDQEKVFIGSLNFDPRSVLWNSEVGVLVESHELAREVHRLTLEGMSPALSYEVRTEERDGRQQLVWIAEDGGRLRVLEKARRALATLQRLVRRRDRTGEDALASALDRPAAGDCAASTCRRVSCTSPSYVLPCKSFFGVIPDSQWSVRLRNAAATHRFYKNKKEHDNGPFHSLLVIADPRHAARPHRGCRADHPLQNMQIHANRATSSLLLYRGEGFRSTPAALEDDLRALNAADAGTQPHQRITRKPSGTAGPASRRCELRHRRDDMPWGFPLQMSKALRDFLTAVRQQGADSEPNCRPRSNTLPCNTSAAPISAPSKSPRTAGYLPRRDERHGAAIDAQLAELDGKRARCWPQDPLGFLRVALQDMNSASNNLTTASGRPFAPIMVDRHTRSLSDQWMAAKP